MTWCNQDGFGTQAEIPDLLKCLQISFEEGQTLQGQFTLTLQLKNEREACLYRPGIGQVSSSSPSVACMGLRCVIWKEYLGKRPRLVAIESAMSGPC